MDDDPLLAQIIINLHLGEDGEYVTVQDGDAEPSSAFTALVMLRMAEAVYCAPEGAE